MRTFAARTYSCHAWRVSSFNSVALEIPCHRVVREDGGLGGYRWGIQRKKKLLEMEKPN